MLNARSFQHCPITYLDIPKVDVIYSWALTEIRVDKLYLPQVWKIEDNVFSEGSINFLPNTDVYDIYMPNIMNIGRNFLSGMRRGVVPLPYKFLLENPDAYLKGIVEKPVQWVDKSRKEVVCIHLEWTAANVYRRENMFIEIRILQRYSYSERKNILKNIIESIKKYFGNITVYGTDHSYISELPYIWQKLRVDYDTYEKQKKAKEFENNLCSLLGRNGACTIDNNNTLRTAVMVYKGSGGSSDNRVTGRMMMMSLKF